MDITTFEAKRSLIEAFLASPEASLLTEQAAYAAGGASRFGRDEVLAAVHDLAFEQTVNSLATPWGEAVRLFGTSGKGAPVMLTVRVTDNGIATIQCSPVPQQSAVSPLRLTGPIVDMINGALRNKRAMVVAYVDEAGQPVLSFRGSTSVIGETQIGLWIRNAEGAFVNAIRVRPRVALMYRDNEALEQFQFQGRARVAVDEAERRRIYEAAPEVERNYDLATVGVGVVIDLDLVDGFLREGPERKQVLVRMERPKI